MSGEPGEHLWELDEAAALATMRERAFPEDGSEAALLALVRHLRMAADSASDAIFVINRSSQFVYLNPHCLRVLGYQANALEGQPIQSVTLEGQTWPHAQTASKATSTGLALVQFRHQSGNGIWMQLSMSPITQGEQVLGWLGIARDVTEQQRTEQHLLNANRELSAVQVVVAETLRANDFRSALDEALQRIIQVLDAEAGAIFLRSGEGALTVGAARGLSKSSTGTHDLTHKLPEEILQRVIESGEPLVLSQDDTGNAAISTLVAERLHHLILVPLRSGERVIGAVSVGRRRHPPFSTEELRTLTSVVSQLGMLIDNAHSNDDLRQQLDRLTRALKAIRSIGESPTPSAVLTALAREAAQLVRGTVTMVLVTAEDGHQLRAAASSGIPGRQWRDFSLSIDQSSLGQSLQNGESTLLRELTADLLDLLPIARHVPDVQSLVVVPLQVEGRLVGALLAFHRHAHAYKAQDQELLVALANHGAVAFERARLLEQARLSGDRLAALDQIGTAILASPDREEVFQSLATQITRVIKVDQLTIALLDDGSPLLDVFTMEPGKKATTGNRSKTIFADAAIGRVLDTGRPLIRSSLEHEAPSRWDGLLLAQGIHSDVTLPLLCQGRILGTFSLASTQAGTYSERDLTLLEQIASNIAVAVAHVKLYQQTLSSLNELRALREVIEFFSAELDLDSLLRKIIAAAVELLHADNGEVALFDEDGIPRLRALHNLPEGQLGRELTLGSGLLGQVLAARQLVIVHNCGDGSRLHNAEEDNRFSGLAVPIWWQDRMLGAFAVGSKDPSRRFHTRDSETLRLLAKHASIAIENARMYGRSREAAVAEERNRLARDIHDTLAQSLTGIVLQLEALSDLLQSGSSEEARQELAETRNLARRSLDEVRQSIWALHPAPLQGMTLEQAIDKEMRTLARQASLATHFSVKGEVRPLPAEIETALFRIAQEALSNVRKHAAANAVYGILQFGEGDVSLSIEDDGVGFPTTGTDTLSTGGFGLTSMRERARLLGGELKVESTRDRGTRLSVVIPERAEQEGAGNQASEPVRQPSPESVSSSDSLIKVLVADDHPIARHGIRRMLEHFADVAIVGEASDGVEAVQLCQELRPDVVLMDLKMPRLNGVEAIQRLREATVETKVLIISTYDKDEFLFDGIKAGAHGYLLKDVPAEELVQAIRAVSRGESLLQTVVAGKLLARLGRLARGEDSNDLTEREMEVMRLLANGARNKEIARQLSIAEKTVKFHVAHIFRKLGASSRTEALAVALERGLLHT